MSDLAPRLDRLNTSSDWRNWSTIWTRFQGRYSNWWNQRIKNLTEPVYWLPESVIRKLSESRVPSPGHNERRPLISPGDVEAERAFAAACLEYSQDTVGVWGGQPVSFDLFSPPQPLGDAFESMLRSLGKSESQITAMCSELIEKSTATRNQMSARTGFLLTLQQFLSERGLLQNLWLQCPAGTRFNLMLAELRPQPAVLFPDRTESDRHPDSCRQFYQQLEQFLQRWELIKFATWELPCVQGPLENVSPQTLCHLGRGNQSIDYTPGYFSQPTSLNPREQLQGRQRAYGEHQQFDVEYPQAGIAPRGDQVSSYASVFKMWFIHTTVIRRYSNLRGLSARLQEAFQDELNLSTERIRSLKKEYTDFLPKVQEDTGT